MEIDFSFYFTVVSNTTTDNILSQLHFHITNQTLEHCAKLFATIHLSKIVAKQLALANNQTGPYIDTAHME